MTEVLFFSPRFPFCRICFGVEACRFVLRQDRHDPNLWKTSSDLEAKSDLPHS